VMGPTQHPRDPQGPRRGRRIVGHPQQHALPRDGKGPDGDGAEMMGEREGSILAREDESEVEEEQPEPSNAPTLDTRQ